MGTRAMLIIAGIGLLVTGTVSLAQFDFFSGPPNEAGSFIRDFRENENPEKMGRQGEIRNSSRQEMRGRSGERPVGESLGREYGTEGQPGENFNEFGSDGDFGKQNQEEDRQRQEFEKRAQEFDERQLDRMKRDMERMEKDVVKRAEKAISSAQKNGIAIPEALHTTLAQVKALIEKVKNLESAQDLMDSGMEEMPALMQDLNEGTQLLQRLSSIPSGMKQATKEIERMEKKYTDLKKAADKAQVDVSTQLNELKSTIEEMKKMRDTVQSYLKDASNIEKVPDLLQDFDKGEMEDLVQEQMAIESLIDAIKNFDRMKKRMAQDITTRENEIKRLKKKNDVTYLTSAFDDMKEARTAIETAMAKKPIDTEDVHVHISAYQEAKDAYDEEGAEIQGKKKEESDTFFENGKECSNEFRLPTGVQDLFR